MEVHMKNGIAGLRDYLIRKESAAPMSDPGLLRRRAMAGAAGQNWLAPYFQL
jgi:hypothetical protein